MSDARLCAELLRQYAIVAEQAGLAELETYGCRGPGSERPWPSVADRRSALPREVAATATREPSFLARLASNRAGLDGAGAEVTAYLELLDRALEDRRLTESEHRDLVAAAELYGLAGYELERIHDQYMESVCAAALADGVVTERERYDLQLVADLLGLRDLDIRLRNANQGKPANGPAGRWHGRHLKGVSGKRVCFTGKLLCSFEGAPLTREHAAQLAEQAGMVVQPRVTRDLDILVVADPATNSGKARKAREYGTRVIAEIEFWPMIGVEVE